MSKRHHRAGPSALDALNQCVRFKYGEMDEDAAAEGHALHEAAETGDIAGLNDDQARDVEQALAYAKSLKTGAGTWIDYKEHRVELKDLTYGTADRILINYEQGILHVADYKFTRVAGDHEFQARTYGAGAYEMMTPEDRKKITKVITTIIAPRLNIIETAEYEPEELLTRVRTDIEALYERIADPWNPPTPCDLCAKCARAGGCPALSQTALQVSKGTGLPVPAAFDPGAMVSTQDRALGQAIAGALENWAEQVKQKNTEFVKNGGTIPGYSMRSRSTGARVPKPDTPTAFSILKGCGFSEDDILQSCNFSINDLAKAHAAVHPESQKATKVKITGALGHITREGSATYLQKTKRVSNEQLIKQLTQGNV